ncbi:transcriptional regulator, LysR family [Sphingopyxis sp. YR583]|jgi:DNA-binding transcriptional LysR family regulator|uniref:LysR family transcriptional regulator n=1 Tax=Sphingopyxis sp. YR583 TaxID=1881047 RepID=UPI0008A74E7E|nr:LysR family transcriptional regulator [Sphingopyxis sp. YR583]SEH14477.1 transcriptional regulator, LysR family [Sphingopyxis sp. YR583]
MIRIEGIAAFVATVEHGSISGAARQLRLSKSVVSERLAELERSLGSALLHRTTRKLSLTEDGSAFLPRAQRITRDVIEAAADIAERRGTLAGALRIAAPVTFGHMHLGPALYPFLKSHPEIQLTLDLDDRRIDVASSGHDAIIRQGVIDDTRLVVWKLAKSRRILVSSADYLAEHGTPTCFEDLRHHRGIFYTNRGASDWHFRTANGPVTVQAKQALGVNNGDMIRDAVAAGLGIAMLPAFIAGPAIRAGKLVAIPLDLAPDEEWIYMAHAQGRDPSAKLRALRDHLKAAFRDPPYWETI